MDDLTLAAEFPPADREAWLKRVEGVLKGAEFDKKLVSRTYDGLRIEPLYQQRAHATPVARVQPGTPWLVMQRVDHPDPDFANSEALHEVANGASGLARQAAGRLAGVPVQAEEVRSQMADDLEFPRSGQHLRDP